MRWECRERFPRHRGLSDPDMHHGTCVTHVPWCMPGSLTSGFRWSRWRRNRSRRMRNPQFYVSGKRPMREILEDILENIYFSHDDVIKWFPCHWAFVWGIHRWPVKSPHKGLWRGAMMFSLIYAWINGWVNNREAGDLRRHRPHYDVSVMLSLRLILRRRSAAETRAMLSWQFCNIYQYDPTQR